MSADGIEDATVEIRRQVWKMPPSNRLIMKTTLLTTAALLSLGVLGARAAEIKSADDLKDTRQKASYGLGVNAGSMWKNRGADIDWDAYTRGIRDSQAGTGNLITDAQIKEAMTQFQTETQTRYQAKLAADGTKNKEAGEKFLADNKAKEGIKTTASGLQYKVVKLGDGPKPATFPLNGVIKGWTEGLQLMPVGSKFQFYIPGDLAYGQNAPPSIGPGQVLIFDVELLKIEPPTAAPAASAGAAAGQPVTSDIIKVPSADELKKGAKIEVIKADDAQKLIDKEKAKQSEKK